MNTDRRPWPAAQGTTLRDLKEQRYSLNMRLLFAARLHDTEMQAALADGIEEIDRQIERMVSNRRVAGSPPF